MDLQVSVTDILMILDGQARAVSGAVNNPQNLDTNVLKSHVARMYAYAEKLDEIAQASKKQGNGEGAGVAN